MMRPCHIYSVFKQISERITSRHKLYDIVTREFYNDKKAITFLSQDIIKRQAIVETKEERDKELVRSRTALVSRTKLMWGTTEVPNIHDFSTFNLKEWWAHKKREYRKYVQRKLYKKHLILGSDLGVAHFVLGCGGRVKFRGHNDWIQAVKKYLVPDIVPDAYDPQYILEGIDLKGYPIEFENLNYIMNLNHLKWLSLRGCDTIDDWAIDKLSTGYPTLEHFDISECIRVTERGLEALYRMPNLKKLIITDYSKSVALELTCFMLEDVNPYLKCEILEPETKLLSQESRM